MKTLRISDLAPGDVVEVKCRLSRLSESGPCFVERWIAGRVLATGEGWPLVRLDDDQLCEIRPFMDWRPVGCRTMRNQTLAA